MSKSWEFAAVWNDSLLTYDQKIIEPREHIYASEIGGTFIDRYLKMLGTKPSNPPNARSQRKFQAGAMYEWIVGYVLQRAGLLEKCQVHLKDQWRADCLQVTGRMDYRAGGIPDFEEAEYEVRKLDLPGYAGYAAKQIARQLREKYQGDKLQSYAFECKSAGSFVMERLIKTNKPLAHNGAQNFFYALRTNLPGKLVYVGREDCMLMEFLIDQTSTEFADIYRKDVEEFSHFFTRKEQPPKEEEFFFEEGNYKFNTNWRVSYSQYLTLLYGYKTPEEYLQKYKPDMSKFNGAFKRCVDCKEMTKYNKETIAEAKKKFPNWDELVENAKIAKAKGELIEEAEVVE
jgi:hypothetical protein